MDHRLELPVAPSPLDRRLAEGAAVIWSQPVTMPTYDAGEPERYPMFFDRRVYQGSSGRVYPIPFIDHVAATSTPRSWRAVHLENRWLRVMVLPELGGRIHVGFDKVAGYDFFYRNDVIKPALVGLAGPWVSGGVEFNWPQHHRPATHLAVETSIEEHDDGAVTVWCSDHDPFARMKGMHGVRLRPDRAAVELVVRLHNRTSEVQTFLWWANVAARVHSDYQSFFPTDVEYVADHARRAVTAFPAADRPYYGVDYPARSSTGGDRIDFYRNIPVPTSYMVTDTVDDFFGGYDHEAGAGFVHVADHRIAPGKKQWTWGNEPFGQAWDRQLTDDSGPYVELMAGVYTDNQPDFAWLEPGETKSFTQLWYPIQSIGPAHQANADAAVRLDILDDEIRLGLCVTARHRDAHVRLAAAGTTLLDRTAELSPGQPLLVSIPQPGATPQEVEVVVKTRDGRELIRWRPRAAATRAEPDTATAPPPPAAVETVEELYLTGVHLAQYRHPTRSPEPYWQEALRRDPGDARTHVALASDRYHRGLYEQAANHARRAIARLTARNGNPRDGEASYLLGLALQRLGDDAGARDALAKAAWDVRWAGPANVELARLDAQAGRWESAHQRGELALAARPEDSRAEAVRVVSLRVLGRGDEAEAILRAWLARDPLDQAALHLSGRATSPDGRTGLDLALELRAAGDSEAAVRVLRRATLAAATPAGDARVMAWYHLGALLEADGRGEEARDARRSAREGQAVWCFPSGLDDHDALWSAINADPTDTRALALAGMLLFDARREPEALRLWESAISQGLADPVTLRNAAIASFRLEGDHTRSVALYDRAIELDPSPRLLYERDQLLALAGAPEQDRLAILESAPDEVLRRDDLTISYCLLLTRAGRAAEALAILEDRRFAPWEGGEGQVVRAWEAATHALSSEAEVRGDIETAAHHARRAIQLPAGLGEARHPLTDTTALHGRLASLLERLGRPDEADRVRADAVVSSTAPVVSTLDGDVDYFATSLPDFFFAHPAGGAPGRQ